MTRREFLLALKHGDLTPEQAREIIIDFAGYINRALSGPDLLDLGSLMQELKRTPQPQEEHQRIIDTISSTLSLKGNGGLGFFSRSTVGSQQLVIHWPTFLMTGIRNPKTPQAQVVWLLQSIFRRRSPLFFSLLRRKYLTELLRIDTAGEGEDGTFDEAEFADITPLDYEEADLCDNLGQRICALPEIGGIVNRAFLSMLITSGVRRAQNYDVLKFWKDGLTKESPLFWETTLISRRRLNELREILRAGGNIAVPDAKIDRPGYGAASWSKIMFDVLTLPHFSTPDGRFGVYKATLTEDELPHIVVNIPLLIKHLRREDKYSRTAEIWRQMAKTASENEIRDRVCLLWGGQSPLLIENRLRSKVDTSSVWPNTKPGDIYVMPLPIFEQYRKAASNMASLRSKIPPEKRGMRGAKNRRGFTKIVQMTSPGIAEAGGAVFYFRVLYRDRTVYLCPGWEQSFDPEFFHERNYTTNASGDVVLKTGIVQNTLTGEYYYSLGRYLGFEGTPVSLYTALRNWLRDFLEGMNHEQFQYMWRSARAAPTHEVHVPRGVAKAPLLVAKAFSPQADEIIRNYLRPGQLVTVEEMLEAIGQRKTRKEIADRSALLRRQLIAEGVYDLNQLPHINYSALRGKRLEKLKEAKLNALKSKA